MKYFKLITASVLFLLIAPVSGMAVDHGGCLTCHKYPGLVRMEKPDNIKVLHIDEEIHQKDKSSTARLILSVSCLLEVSDY